MYRQWVMGSMVGIFSFGWAACGSDDADSVVAEVRDGASLTDSATVPDGSSVADSSTPPDGSSPPDSSTPPNGCLDPNAINVADYGAKANAHFFDPSTKKYYQDANHTVPSEDATQAINEAIQDASKKGIVNVCIPDGTYLIKAEAASATHQFEYSTHGGIQLQDNVTLTMSSGVKLVMNTGSQGGYAFISIDHKKNVKVIGGRIEGDKDTHPPDKHNYCYGINIANGSSDVLIEDVDISNCEDDGIMIADYLEPGYGGGITDHVRIHKVKMHHNGRQGLSITSGTNISVTECELSHQTKHDPKSGIDIELENFEFRGVKNVTIARNTFEGNTFAAIVVSDMRNELPQSLSENIVITENTIAGDRWGVVVPGWVKGLEISNNTVTIDPVNYPCSAGITTSAPDSDSVLIRGNHITSTHKECTIGILLWEGNNHVDVLENHIIKPYEGIVVVDTPATVKDNVIEGTVVPISGAPQDGNTIIP
ncbi:MAG TPA: right-handed parallel beta-helix repeat-containing protein [Polyangiaceae bacterium]|nr:right-handed parallel beta-helix repeat-containing protein [Polyangiaceae bacterium]